MIVRILLLVLCQQLATVAVSIKKGSEANVAEIKGICPEGWQRITDKCYLAHYEERSWPQALATCERYSAQLASVESYNENKFLATVLMKPGRGTNHNEFWIGLFGFKNGGSSDDVSYVWSDGTATNQYIGFWDEKQPDINGGSCAMVSLAKNELKWRMKECNLMRGFLCQTQACLKGSFFCFSGQCIPESKHCNGIDDCGDLSDELNCPSSHPDLACLQHSKGDSGRLATPNYPSAYRANSDCKWVLEGPPNTRIHLTFDSFETESFTDMVTLMDGGPSNNHTNVLASLSGSLTAGSVFHSATNMITLKFRSDSEAQFKGFEAHWKAVPFSCGGVLSAQSYAQSISSPNYPLNYPNSTECPWLVQTTKGNLITLTVEDLDLAEDDRVVIYNGDAPSAAVLQVLTGSSDDSQIIISTTNNVYIYMQTNNVNSKRGFSLSYKKGCDITLKQSYGTVVSPGNMALQYPPTANCSYHIEMPNESDDTSFSIQMNKFDLGPYDHLKVFEGSAKDRPLHDGSGFSSSAQPPSHLISRQSSAEIIFESSALQNGLGFNFTFSSNCSPIKSPPLVSLSTKNTAFGSKITVSCPSGFEFVDGRGLSFEVSCQKGGIWSKQSIPSCQPVYCSAVPQISNGFAVSASNVSFGGMAKYSCYDGFKFPSGAKQEEIYCNEHGKWSQLPECHAATCPALPPFVNGHRKLDYGGGTGYGTVYSFKCSDGYKRIGAANLLCQSNGQWSFEQPTCTKLACHSIPSFDNGRILVSEKLLFGDSAKIECDMGFRVDGPDEVKCLANQSLSDIPKCIDIDECAEGLAQCQSTSTVCQNMPGGYHCQCFEGYQPQLVCSSATVISSSKWSFSSVTFEMNAPSTGWCASSMDTAKSIKLHYTVPKVIERIRFGKTDFGHALSVKVKYQTNEVKRLNTMSIDRQEEFNIPIGSGEFDFFELPYAIEAKVLEIIIMKYKGEPCMKIEVIGCQKHSCADINECMKDNGNCEHNCINKQGTYQCSCRDGYDLFTLNGTNGINLVEEETGLDKNDIIRFNQSCIARLCPSILAPENGILLSTVKEFRHPTTVQFQCDFGYQMMGAQYIQCLADGTWNGTEPFCLPATCQGLRSDAATGIFVSPENSTISFGENVSVICTQENRQPHTSSLFSSFRQCIFDPKPDGREYWLSGPPVDCPLVQCAPLPTVAGVLYLGDHDNYYVGSSFEFSCRPPYSLFGQSTEADHTVRCKKDGHWDYGDLRCEGPVCVDPGFPPDGSLQLNSVEEGAVAHYKCNRPGFIPFPSADIQCVLGSACILSEDVGISSGIVPDGAFSDSSNVTNPKYKYGYEAHKARMSSTGWCGLKDQSFVFLSVDLQRNYTLTTLRLAGVVSGHMKGHVTKLQLFYKTGLNDNYDTYPVEFETPSGNHLAMHQFELNPPLRARYILLGVAEYEGSPCLRFDLLGCLAPSTKSHEIPTHLQVGWNGTVPQCIDAEPPQFTKCPKKEILVEIDENGQLLPVYYELPEPQDNSGRIAYVRVEPAGFAPGRFISSDLDVLYTSFDDAGNTADCRIRLRIPDTLPPVMKCPDSYALAARGPFVSLQFNVSTVPMVVQDVSNITEIIFSPSSVTLNLGEFVDVTVTATDSHANRNQCKFQVAYQADPCSSESLITTENTVKSCVPKDGSILCTVSCKEGFRFVDEEKINKNFACSEGKWGPSAVAPSCVRNVEEPARFEMNIALTYPINASIEEQCLAGYSTLISRSYEELDRILTERCSNTEPVMVKFLQAQFVQANGVVTGNYTIQILPTMQQDVFYDLCALTLRTIFDIGLRGMKMPVRSVLEIQGDSIPSASTGCPSLKASRSTVTQGFGCNEGEVLRNKAGQLPECLPCPPGSVNVNNTCLLCPLGSYQDESGKIACKACDDGSYTMNEGSPSKAECLDVCGNGMYSDTGLVPCQVCPRHSFSGPPVIDGYKQCTACPSGTYTAKVGAHEAAKCRQPCKPGTFSVTGLEPCSPCPLHHYQPTIGQQRCIECSNETATEHIGASAAEMCVPVECRKKGCKYEYECSVINHSPFCECRPGFAGSVCEKSDDYCSLHPCHNGGQCEAVAGSFRCLCGEGFFGSRCEFSPDDCSGRICPNGGVCHNLPAKNATKCLCRNGFAGPDCSEVTDICAAGNPCQNGADCIASKLGRYKCRCLPGWEGQNCQKNIDDCASSPCALNSTCMDLINDFECHCPTGFTGKRCNIKEDFCASSPCEHGICVDKLYHFECLCQDGWMGKRCNETVNKCESEPCKNGGSCVAQINGYSCHCAAGFKGLNCQHMVDHCGQSPCKNNASCVNHGSSYECACLLGFEGPHCEKNTDDCAHNTCNKENTESCVDSVNSFDCTCKPGYTGEFCDAKMNQCISSPCENNGSCIDVGSSFKCDCPEGWTGLRCEKEMGICSNNPCRNEGHCIPLSSDYFCVCPKGVSGKNCEHTPNRCIGEPCVNGGVCGDFGSRHQCTCPKHFTGPGCQYAKPVCTEGLCQNGGSCEDSSGEAVCLCTAGFTGVNCESNIDDCALHPCPVNSVCIDQVNSVYCKCPEGKTGPNCDKDIDEDYDIVFSQGAKGSFAAQLIPVSLKTDGFSLSLWVKFQKEDGNGEVLTIYNSSHPNISMPASELLQLDSEGLKLNIFPSIQPLRLHFTQSQKINNHKWNHIVFTWSSETGSYSLIWNSIRIFSEEGYGSGKQLDANALVVLGSKERSAFVGSITNVRLFNRVLDFENEIPQMAMDCRRKQTASLLTFSGYNHMFGMVERVPKSSCGRESVKRKTEDTQIVVNDCPKDLLFISKDREMNITWEEPTFVSENSILKIEKNMNPGQVFTWGEYDILYIAYDNSSNTAQCSFKIRLSQEHCASVADPLNGLQACEAWGPQLRYKACSIECRDGFEFSRDPPLFYTCSSDGKWSPRDQQQEHFKYPQCTKSIPATRIIVLKLAYPSSTVCSDMTKETIKAKIKENVNEINGKWDLCSMSDSDGCVGVQIEVDCSMESARKKRETHQFQVRIEVPVKRTLVSNKLNAHALQVQDALQEEILTNGAFNLEKILPAGRPDMTSFQLSDQYQCQPGFVNVRDTCVPCSSGSFFSSESSSCQLCERGFYQPLTARFSCFQCENGQTTADKGAINEAECKANCPPGHFLNSSVSRCDPCGVGYYQSLGGSFSCNSCQIGKTTLSDKAVLEEECRDECPDGEQLSSSGLCQPCAVGSYRTKGEQKQCQTCPIGTTTEFPGSVRRDQCNIPRCKIGQFLVKETKHCQLCPRGTYQNEEQQNLCKLCPKDHTTAAQGATAASQCYSTNQCETGEDTCSFHSLCIDLPDDNDLPSYTCKCKPGYKGNGTVCYDACTSFCLNDGVCRKNPVGYVECECKETFDGERCENRIRSKSQTLMSYATLIGLGVALLLVAVAVFFIINCHFKKLDSIQTEKVNIEEFPQSNFYYSTNMAAIEPACTRPIGYYYEDDDQYESKSAYVREPEDERDIEQRIQMAQRHMYRPTSD